MPLLIQILLVRLGLALLTVACLVFGWICARKGLRNAFTKTEPVGLIDSLQIATLGAVVFLFSFALIYLQFLF